MHYTALWVLNCDPSTGKDRWSSMTLLGRSARDAIHIQPWVAPSSTCKAKSQQAVTQLAGQVQPSLCRHGG